MDKDLLQGIAGICDGIGKLVELIALALLAYYVAPIIKTKIPFYLSLVPLGIEILAISFTSLVWLLLGQRLWHRG